MCVCVSEPTADRVAQNLEIVCNFFHSRTGRTKILMSMGIMISTMLLPGTHRKSHGKNPGMPTKFES